jgi:hypothetical protein
MHKSATKCNETLGKWCKNKHGASKIMDTLETYQRCWPKENYLRDRNPQLEYYISIKNSGRAIRGANNHNPNIIEASKTLGN